MQHNGLRPAPRAILFDLDGTLADTAPDLAAAVNKVRVGRQLSAAPYEMLRPFASAGARGLIGAAFGVAPGDPDYEELRVAFLANYTKAICVESVLFDGVAPLLAELERRNIAWGIVTNKADRLTKQLVPQLGLKSAACIISGDTTTHAKPHPAPLLEAAHRLLLPATDCWYVGDDLRDIEAGRAAGMTTIAAAWGYCGVAGPHSWDADVVLDTPLSVLALLDSNIHSRPAARSGY
ncbi:MAG: phosphoglycolate phosphatase [Burkholderiaceae bacterium]